MYGSATATIILQHPDSNLVRKDYTLVGVPIIRGSNLNHSYGYFDSSEFAFVSEEKADKLSANTTLPGDIVFTQRGTLGQIGIVPQNLPYKRFILSQSQMKLTCDPVKAYPLYIYYYFKSSEMLAYIKRHAITTGVPHTNLTILKQTPLILPPLPEQKAIARILSSLDDKIELNREMNKTLEAIAQATFKSWFVDFDPVRAKMEGKQPAFMDAATAELFPDAFEESALGLIPQGWKVQTIGEVLEFAYGKALKEDARQPGSIPVYGSNGRIGWHNEALVESPSVVVGRKGNAGTVIWSPTSFFPIDTTFYVVPKGSIKSLYYLLYALRLQDLPSLGADSAVPGLNRNIAYMNQLLVPEGQCLIFFDSQVQSLYKKMQVNDEETCTLASIRDTLLPKLLSGEIRVTEADKIVEEVM